MQYSRSHRRHHAERLKVKRRKESSRWYRDHPEALARNVGMRLHSSCLCSCSMCGNPRRHYGNSLAALSRQELRSWKADDQW